MNANMPMTEIPDYRARYYDPTIGRFVSEDPVGFWGGLNFYAYVLNDPAGLTDPMGESPCLNIRNFVDGQ
jgi:RHS repeat-associated protein